MINNTLSHEERDALKLEIFHSLHCALPGNILSFDPDTQTASIQPAVKIGSLPYPVLTDVPVFMPVSFEINSGDACLVIFSDVDIDAWFETGEASVPNSPRSLRCRTGLRLSGSGSPRIRRMGDKTDYFFCPMIRGFTPLGMGLTNFSPFRRR